MQTNKAHQSLYLYEMKLNQLPNSPTCTVGVLMGTNAGVWLEVGDD
jgi:hypothetical protein